MGDMLGVEIHRHELPFGIAGGQQQAANPLEANGKILDGLLCLTGCAGHLLSTHPAYSVKISE